MIKLHTEFHSEEEKKALVDFGERAFRQRLSDAVESIAKRRDLSLITVSGPSCSGKTTSSLKLEAALEEHGYSVHVISIDDYFLDRDFLISRAEERGETIDFDSPDTLDFTELERTVDAIVSRRGCLTPVFSFQLGRRTGYKQLLPSSEGDVYLFEGIQAVYPEVLSCFPGASCASLFVCPEADILTDRARLCATDVRFLRRLVRDAKFRDAAPEFTFEIWESVRQNEEKNIFPNLSSVQYRVNSYLEFELYMIAPLAIELLAQIPSQGRFGGAARRYLEILSSLPEIPLSYLPPDSLFREFVG